MNTENIRSLTSAIMLQAVKDFARGSAKNRQAILKDLRSKWMDFISDGFSLIVAEQLEKHPEEIIARMHKYANEEKANEE